MFFFILTSDGAARPGARLSASIYTWLDHSDLDNMQRYMLGNTMAYRLCLASTNFAKPKPQLVFSYFVAKAWNSSSEKSLSLGSF